MKRNLILATLLSVAMFGCGGGGSGGGGSGGSGAEDKEIPGEETKIGHIDSSRIAGTYLILDEEYQFGKVFSVEVTENGYMHISYISTGMKVYSGGGYVQSDKTVDISFPMFHEDFTGDDYPTYIGDATFKADFSEQPAEHILIPIDYTITTPIDGTVSGNVVRNHRFPMEADLSMLSANVETATDYKYDADNNLLEFVSRQGCHFAVTPKANSNSGRQQISFDAVVESANCDVKDNTGVVMNVEDTSDRVINHTYQVYAANEFHIFHGYVRKSDADIER